jgi:hypothetical protein
LKAEKKLLVKELRALRELGIYEGPSPTQTPVTPRSQ